jgi:hypothetical protein
VSNARLSGAAHCLHRQTDRLRAYLRSVESCCETRPRRDHRSPKLQRQLLSGRVSPNASIDASSRLVLAQAPRIDPVRTMGALRGPQAQRVDRVHRSEVHWLGDQYRLGLPAMHAALDWQTRPGPSRLADPEGMYYGKQAVSTVHLRSISAAPKDQVEEMYWPTAVVCR